MARRGLAGAPPRDERRLTVEKIGGTSMSRALELLDTVLIGSRQGPACYQRIFVVSAFAGMTNALLEHKKTAEPGVYGLFATMAGEARWSAALDDVGEAMRAVNAQLLSDATQLHIGNAFVDERIQGLRHCLLDLQRLCSYGHFQLTEHLHAVREMLAALGEAHSAHTLTLLLQHHGVNACLVDLTGWREDDHLPLDERIQRAFAGLDLGTQLPIVTGYAQCRDGLMREFDRGYSEVTFAAIASLLNAREAIIHKEFHLSSADPQLIGADKVRKIGRTNYDVADQLSNMGMEAIHPKAAKRLRQAGVPLRVTNAFEPQDPGTLIDVSTAARAGVEIVSGLALTRLELFEQDMVGVKGYDAAILDALARHRVRIVSKTSNANTIVHHIQAPASALVKVEADLAARFPLARISAQPVSLVSIIGRDLRGLKVMLRGLKALGAAGIEPIAMQECGRAVDVQFVLQPEDQATAIEVLHDAFFDTAAVRRGLSSAA